MVLVEQSLPAARLLSSVGVHVNIARAVDGHREAAVDHPEGNFSLEPELSRDRFHRTAIRLRISLDGAL